MDEAILVISTPPGRLPRGGQLRIGTYQVLFIYEISPAILDKKRDKVVPTRVADLVSVVGQSWIDRYMKPDEVAAFESGDAAWELISGARVVVRDPDQTLRIETVPEMTARLQGEFAIRKSRAIAEWTAEYEFAGHRISP